MIYKTIMVRLELGRSNAGLLEVVGDIASQCHASVIGIAVWQPMISTLAGAAYVSGEMLQQEREELESEARIAGAEFETLLRHRVKDLDWRSASTVGLPVDFIAREARSVDLIVTSPNRGGSIFSDPRRVDVGDLVMQAGRPVLLVPQAVTGLQFDQMLLAWKDRREARRAALDALPLLKMAKRVTLAEIVARDDEAAARDRLKSLAGWLASHGVDAESHVETAKGSDAGALAGLAHRIGANVIVAGAYGHSRLREWAFGGVTLDLLLNPSRCTLLSR